MAVELRALHPSLAAAEAGIDLSQPLDDASPGSLCVIYVDRAATEALTATNRWTLLARINDVDDREAAAIFRRTP